MSLERMKLGELLVKKGLISKEQLDTAIEYQKSLGGKIGNIIVKLGYMSDEKLTKIIARTYNMDVTDLGKMILPINLFRTVPRDIIEKHNVIPVHVSEKVLTVAIADPTDYDALDELQFVTGKKIETTLATRDAIKRAIAEFQDDREREERRSKGALKPVSQSKLRPASKGSLQALDSAGESGLVEKFTERAQSEGSINTGTLTRSDLRSALIPVLLKKGIITENELFDAVIGLLKRKDVIDQKDLTRQAKGT